MIIRVFKLLKFAVGRKCLFLPEDQWAHIIDMLELRQRERERESVHVCDFDLGLR